MKVSFKTDIGCTRSQNQDAVFVSEKPVGPLENLFIVADGMGGHNAGDYASKKAIDLIFSSIREDKEDSGISAIQRGITIANREIFIEASQDQEKSGMGTTVVVATIENGMLEVANVGDSRLYVLSKGDLIQVTRDHSVIEEMVRKGEVSREMAQKHPKRNLITRAVGAEEEVRIDLFDVDLSDVDAVLMCTDGLTTMVEDAKIAEIMSLGMTVEHKVAALIKEANAGGGKDNITVLMIESMFDEV